MLRTLIVAGAATWLLWWLLRPRPKRRRASEYAVVTSRIVRQGRLGAIYGLRCSVCGSIGEAVGQRGAEWASTEHLRLDHSATRGAA